MLQKLVSQPVHAALGTQSDGVGLLQVTLGLAPMNCRRLWEKYFSLPLGCWLTHKTSPELHNRDESTCTRQKLMTVGNSGS